MSSCFVAPPFGEDSHTSPPLASIPAAEETGELASSCLYLILDNGQLLGGQQREQLTPLFTPVNLGWTMQCCRLWVAICLLLNVSCRFSLAARHGCLFAKKLCTRDELCSDDGLFGQCWAPHHDPVQYLVSLPALHKLQEVLKDLMAQGMTWRDGITQATIGRELSHIPSIRSSQLHQRNQLLSQRRFPRPEEAGDPQKIQQHIDYQVLDPSSSSIHGQMPLPEPYIYQQDEAERSLNSLEENPTSPFVRYSSPRTGSRGKALERDKQLLRNLVSYYLTFPPSSYSSSSSTVQPASRYRGAPAESFALASSLPELDFPRDYDQDYISQIEGISKQPLSNVVPKYDALAGLDARSVQRLTQLLDHYGLEVQDLSPEQRDKLPALLKQLQLESSFSHKATKENSGKNVSTGKKITEGVMEHKMAAPDGLPIIKSSKPVEVQKDTHFAMVGKLEKNIPEKVFAPVRTYETKPNLMNLSGKEVPDKSILEPETSTKILQNSDGQDLCRQHMTSKGAFGRLEAAALGAVGGPSGGGAAAGAGRGPGAVGGADSRVSSMSSQFSDGAQPSPSSHSSTPSWCEEPAQANLDISTGHMILAYMEDHLSNKDRLLKEWELLCSYQAEPSSVTVAQSELNTKKNRFHHSLPYDHTRVKLKPEINPSRSDYINASTIIEHDPRLPAYIATQGPLSHTISDFWQMVWETGCTVIVMMTALVEEGEKQCDRYWPDEGSSLYHIYEVNLVSEHIWCNDFLVRSFYLKNVQTQETRTLTQFHFLSWPANGIPASTRPLLDFRRKVNKCYRGRACPIIIHCSNGTGRTGTYILIDMVLNRMAKGVKEMDIAATLEHIRDQRPGMVRTKDQFEFALTAVAEEVNAVLKAQPQ
ncbi:receptor-type tyrosine-protein phosphatase-like N isoform X3 [Hippocampus zosterae]|uniref:receptor-type tyrosine-protein phosphatase-like N isoform X3 n=1 Tax=Hippocampus zosterae TaxID=109293 RepID=UPI00223DBE51|nr:receptor-type tyrosine-protein phosphatase-like N isoform X3 [Hippocampus zosterae]